MPVLMGCGTLKRIGIRPDAERTVDRSESSARRGADVIRQLLAFAGGQRAEGEMTSGAARGGTGENA